jgi:hypothetical protein
MVQNVYLHLSCPIYYKRAFLQVFEFTTVDTFMNKGINDLRNRIPSEHHQSVVSIPSRHWIRVAVAGYRSWLLPPPPLQLRTQTAQHHRNWHNNYQQTEITRQQYGKQNRILKIRSSEVTDTRFIYYYIHWNIHGTTNSWTEIFQLKESRHIINNNNTIISDTTALMGASRR